jgi:hypothetical protein
MNLYAAACLLRGKYSDVYVATTIGACLQHKEPPASGVMAHER